MAAVQIKSSDMRVPREAREALSDNAVVEVLHHRNLSYVLLSADDYAVVEPIIDRRHRRLPVPVEALLTDEDFAVLDDERVADAGLAQGILNSWE